MWDRREQKHSGNVIKDYALVMLPSNRADNLQLICTKLAAILLLNFLWLDECFERRVGKCDATAVSTAGAAGYRLALARCDYRRSHTSSEGTTPLIGSPAEDAPSRLQLVSTLGYLQTQCALSRSKNCSSEHVHNIMAQCEERMKPRAGYPQFDRHRLLRIKLDTSKKLLLYSETDKERECLVVRSTLSEMYTLHHAHCYHSLVTRCLCERLRLDVLCEIRCDRLEPTSPNQNQLAWDEWRDARLISSLAVLSHIFNVFALSFISELLR
ncbi:hypothetical protein ANCDUO_00334 [Ancylostoma duodenale]|uniref:Uncharacterized protein n=1 Tax=Ancylostoma duodenale TaxID=51022 RepID=A0A0C2HCF3_9BILA|nr:hypothetical protein ANCDUO_00334 [Ancylostoma duodenale]